GGPLPVSHRSRTWARQKDKGTGPEHLNEELMSTLWSGRFDTPPDAAALEFGASFAFDRRLFEDDVTGSIAWARALAHAGVLSREEAVQIEEALDDILQQGRTRPSFISGDDEDVHSF